MLSLLSPLWSGSADIGEELLDNYFTFSGQTFALTGSRNDWLLGKAQFDASEAWTAELNKFSWLNDLRATDTPEARVAAASIISAWMGQNRRHSAIAWRADIVAERLYQWLTHLDFVTSTREPEYLRGMIISLSRQARFLLKSHKALAPNSAQFTIAKGLITAGVALDDFDRARFEGLKLLERVMTQQCLADGGHISRCPAQLENALRNLVEIRTLLFEGGRDQPEILNQQIQRMGAALKLFRDDSGRIAHMNQLNSNRPERLERLLQRIGDTDTVNALPNMGFLRLKNRRGQLLCDCAGPPPKPFDRQAHAGATSFEYLIGSQPLVVNCGTPTQPDVMGHSQRFTAAHSTLNIADRHSSDLLTAKNSDSPLGFGKRRTRVTAHHDHYDAFDLIQIEQDGYEQIEGGIHRRTLQLTADGEQLDGEDFISNCALEPIDIRFHLHPDVKPRHDANRVALRLLQGRGFSFTADGGNVRLSPSVYFDKGRAVATTQIIVRANVQQGQATIRWTISREGRAARASLT